MMLFILLGIGGFLWAAAEYTRAHPLDLTSELPKVAKYALPKGVGLQAEKVELFFDNGPVVRISGLGVTGTDGKLGIFVEQAAIKLALSRLLLLSPAPKIIEASGVTLRVVRGVNGVTIAGLDLKSDSGGEGVVEWFNGLGWDRTWGRIQTFRVANLNLLVRDDVQHAEWVLENGNLQVGRYYKDGERGTLTAVVRRLYGSTQQLQELNNVPVLVSFAHAYKADGMIIRGRLDRADAQMVTDYFPPQFKDLLQAQGQVEVGTRLMEDNQIERPWITLRLTDVSVQPPKGFSAPLKFPKLSVTASYIPPVDGVSDSDVLAIRELQATTERGNVLAVSGTISGIQSDPLINLSLTSPEGDIQGVFDLFPDQEHGFAKALKWLRPNIQAGTYGNLRAHYLGKPSAFPGCGDQCGTLDIDGDFEDGAVRFLDEISPLKADAGSFTWRGQTMTVTVPQGKVANESASGLKLVMSNIFSPDPTDLHVTGTLRGEVSELMAELGKLPETHGKIPQGVSGRHVSQLDILVPMPRGQEPSFGLSTVMVSSSVANVAVQGLDELKGLTFAAPMALVTLDAAKTLRVQGDGTLGDNPMTADWSMNIAPKVPAQMKLIARGTADGEWLMKQAPTDLVSLTGPVGISANLQQDLTGKWLFSVKADGGRSVLKIDEANFTKPKGERLSVDANGSYVPSGTVILEKLDVLGNKLAVGGSVRWVPNDLNSSIVDLPNVKLGDTDASVVLAAGKATITGNRLDLRSVDIFGSKDTSNTVPSDKPDNLQLAVSVTEVLTEKGKLQNVIASLKATKGHWDVQRISALVDGSAKVNVQMVPLKGAAGRKKLIIDVQDLGRTLDALGVYDKLSGGHLSGEIVYDTPDVGGGTIKIENFELKNPPVLVRLLGLLSLEQLLASTGSMFFKTAVVPLKVDNGVWYINNANLEGPSMGLRLNGNYDGNAKQLDIDGKMAPSIPLNRLVGKIPLLGTILTGSQDGVVVADFKIKGSTDDPQINVRPLSVITPGLLKDFWHGLTGGDDAANKPKAKGSK